MKRLFALITILIPVALHAQFNPEAAEIIRPISENLMKSSGVEIDFVFTFENKQEDITETNEGKVFLKGNKYKLNMLGVSSFFDGKSQWIHMIEEEEVNITEPDLEDEEEFTPVNIFTMYEKGFRFKIIEDVDKLITIDMIPDDAEKPFHKIRLKLDKKNKTFVMVKSFGRDGIDNIIDIKSTKKDLNINDEFFVFNASDYPNVEVIDMR